MRQSNELRVFISSTFRDFQEEREHLIKKIFPEIRALCRARGVTFTDIDLRWGITEEEAEREGIIRICLDEIDRCRPYFIGILGERYGWTPPRSDAERVADAFPVLADAMIYGASITEMEIVHGVLANPAMIGHAFFYFRDRAATPTEFIDTATDSAQRLRDLKQRIRESGLPVHDNFTSPVELGAWLEEDIRRVIDTEYPESETPSALELKRRAHQDFAASRRRAYIANPKYAQNFAEWLAAPPLTDPPVRSLPLVITAASGLGKSSLIAYLVDEYRSDHPMAFVIEHYVGASQTSGSATSIMLHVVEEICERFGVTEELPAKPEELEKSFPNWLFRAEHYAKQAGISMLLVIDAVNQLDEAGRRLTWLPKTIPAGIRLLVSTTPGECADHLAQRSWATLEVAPIDDERVRGQIVSRYLGEFRKSITSEQTRRLITDAKAAAPLYLRVVSEELRLHGKHETLDAVIDRYVSAVDLLDVFDRVLERFENDYGVATVQRLMSVLWASRSGLSELELIELAGVSRIDLSRLLFAIDYHFLKREGLLGFFHDYLRRAVEKRNLSDEGTQRSIHLQIAEYFQSGVSASIAGNRNVPLRMAGELAYQLHAGGAIDRLRECLSTMPVFLALYSNETEYEVLGYWSAMVEGTDIEANYRNGLERWEVDDARERSVCLGRVANLLERLGRWAGAIELEEGRRNSAINRGDRNEEASSRRSLGWLLLLRGDYAEALGELSRALDLFTELDDHRGTSLAIGNMGGVYIRRGEYDRALESFQRQLSICEELGDRRGVSQAFGNMGIVYDRRGEYDRALECYQQLLSIATDLGDRSHASTAIGNMGGVYSSRGEHDRALECFQRTLSICEELGYRSGASTAIGNMGGVYCSRGEYDQALECFQRQLSITTDLGDRSGASTAVGNMGIVYYSLGKYDQALECFQRHLSIDTELGDRRGISFAIGSIGAVYAKRGEYSQALESLQQQLSIDTELGDRRGASMAIGSIGVVYLGRGEYDRALERLHRAAEEHRAIGDRSALNEWLQETAVALLEILATAKEMPEYLLTYLPDITADTWRATSLQHTRKVADECVAISEELQMPDTLFQGRILLARVASAEGHVDAGITQLGAMMAAATDDEQRADLHYWLWKLDAIDIDHRSEALHFYQQLIEKSPQHEYMKRIEELTAS